MLLCLFHNRKCNNFAKLVTKIQITQILRSGDNEVKK